MARIDDPLEKNAVAGEGKTILETARFEVNDHEVLRVLASEYKSTQFIRIAPWWCDPGKGDMELKPGRGGITIKYDLFQELYCKQQQGCPMGGFDEVIYKAGEALGWV